MFSGKIWGLFTLSTVLKCQSMNASWSSRLWFFDLLAAADFCKGRTSSQVAWTVGNTIMSVVVAALVSTRCRMDTKRSRLKKNDQQPAAASSPPKPVKLQIYKEPWLLLSLDSKPAPELLWFQNLPPGHFYTICSHWSWSEASLGKTKN